MTQFSNDLVFEASLDELLYAGGDSRAVLDAASGKNRYRCSANPSPQITPLGSCTASTISPRGYGAAMRMLSRLRAVGNTEHLDATVEECFRHIRSDLRYLLSRTLAGGLSVVLTPSGTDAEILPAAIAAGDLSRPLCNVVIGPSELGSGTSLAAACRHFDDRAPSGRSTTPGTPIDDALARRVDLVEIAIRDRLGVPRPVDDIDDEVVRIVDRRIAAGERVLLHITAHSKTGAHAPSLGAVQRLRIRHPDRLDVVVDASQGRFSRRGLIQVLRHGYMVIVTGSKFYGGPAFAGAVLVPENCNPGRRGIRSLPRGFSDFLARPQLPTSWDALRRDLPVDGNVGLLLRWSAAIEEIRAYYATPSLLRLAVLRAFERAVPDIFGNSAHIRLTSVPTPNLSDDDDRLLQSKTTVFSFRVQDVSPDRHLSFAELRQVFQWMDTDLSRLIPDASAEDRRALASRLQIGQPVCLSSGAAPETAVLRIANGGVLVGKVAEDLSIGDTLEQRIGWMEDQLVAAKRKIEIATKYHTHVSARLAMSTQDHGHANRAAHDELEHAGRD